MIDVRVADKLTDNTARRPLRALYEWLTGATTPLSSPDALSDRTEEVVPKRIGHYAIARKLGEGGMGVVYAARDERLGRTVAVKTMSSIARDETARKRFWREARSAASVNHPNVCQIYEIGEDAGELFIAMELLEGEVLAERLRRGPLSAAEAVPIGVGVLAALSALHARGIVHRDLKPSNVFLTAHGVKLLDFGLARPELDGSLSEVTDLTRTGVVLGTPRYMAPEQVTGETVDSRSDLFAAGAILFEMLAGRPAFAGRTIAEVLHATRYEQPPALTGAPAVAAVDRVIRRALAKRPEERPASAAAMAEELRDVSGVDTIDTPILAHTAHAARSAAVSHPAARSRNGLSGLQPARRHRDVARGDRVTRPAVQRRGRPVRRGDAGSQGAGGRGRRRSCGDGDDPAVGRPAASRRAARRSAKRYIAHVAHGSVVAGRSVPAAG